MALQTRKTTTTAASTGNSGGGKVDPFAARFNKAAAENKGGNYENLPIGVWEALACKGGLLEKDGSESAWIEFLVTQKGAACVGKTGRAFYNMVNSKGEDNEVGMAILARTLTDLGKIDEEGIQSKKHLETVLESLEQETVWVEIHVTVKAGYTNIKIKEVMDDQDSRPEMADYIPEKHSR